MRLEAKKYLYDMQQGTTLLTEFTSAKSFDDYRHDPLLKSAVERQFEIIGEALAKLAKLDQALATLRAALTPLDQGRGRTGGGEGLSGKGRAGAGVSHEPIVPRPADRGRRFRREAADHGSGRSGMSRQGSGLSVSNVPHRTPFAFDRRTG